METIKLKVFENGNSIVLNHITLRSKGYGFFVINAELLYLDTSKVFQRETHDVPFLDDIRLECINGGGSLDKYYRDLFNHRFSLEDEDIKEFIENTTNCNNLFKKY